MDASGKLEGLADRVRRIRAGYIHIPIFRVLRGADVKRHVMSE